MAKNRQSGLEDVHGCNEWNTCYEEKVNKNHSKSSKELKDIKATSLNEIEKQTTKRVSTGFNELDRVLGGGLVKGSLTLLGGEPGIRKINLNITNIR